MTALQPSTDRATGRTATQAGLAADLELVREQIKQLRAERDKLRDQVRLQHGQQLDQLSNRSLIERIDELTANNQRLADQQRAAADENEHLCNHVNELTDDLTAARTSLRRVMRQLNAELGR
jgi:predicted nuclease with TOPRIM domain